MQPFHSRLPNRTMKRIWYIGDDECEQGPFTEDQMMHWYRNGALRTEMMIRLDDDVYRSLADLRMQNGIHYPFSPYDSPVTGGRRVLDELTQKIGALEEMLAEREKENEEMAEELRNRELDNRDLNLLLQELRNNATASYSLNTGINKYTNIEARMFDVAERLAAGNSSTAAPAENGIRPNEEAATVVEDRPTVSDQSSTTVVEAVESTVPPSTIDRPSSTVSLDGSSTAVASSTVSEAEAGSDVPPPAIDRPNHSWKHMERPNRYPMLQISSLGNDYEAPAIVLDRLSQKVISEELIEHTRTMFIPPPRCELCTGGSSLVNIVKFIEHVCSPEHRAKIREANGKITASDMYYWMDVIDHGSTTRNPA